MKTTKAQSAFLGKIVAALAARGAHYFTVSGRSVHIKGIPALMFGRGEAVAFAGLKAAGVVYETTDWATFGHPRVLALGSTARAATPYTS